MYLKWLNYPLELIPPVSLHAVPFPHHYRTAATPAGESFTGRSGFNLAAIFANISLPFAESGGGTVRRWIWWVTPLMPPESLRGFAASWQPLDSVDTQRNICNVDKWKTGISASANCISAAEKEMKPSETFAKVNGWLPSWGLRIFFFLKEL